MQPETPVNPLRRRIVLGLAASGVAIGAGAVGLRLAEAARTPDFSHPAYAAWTKTEKAGLSDYEYMIVCAHLAPSAHNIQPWYFSAGEDLIEIRADLTRNIGAADPDNRQLHQSLGCALENLLVAAAYLGYRAEPTIPEGPIGRRDIRLGVRLTPDPAARATVPDGMFDAIFSRMTNRGAYDPATPVPDALRAALRDAVADDLAISLADRGSPDAAYITSTMRMAARDVVADEAFFRDSMSWWRVDRETLYAKGDGISLHTAEVPLVVKAGIQTFVSDEAWFGDFGRQGEIDGVDGVVGTTPLWGVIATRNKSLGARIRGGHALERIYLEATRAGFAVHPLNYAAEHPRSAEILTRRFGFPLGGEILSVFRIGKGSRLEPSPRRPWRDLIV
ncbi:MAG: Acg family FMN-binding oxidoreductase [Salinarimonas sp.]